MAHHPDPALVKALFRVGDHLRRHFKGCVAAHGLNPPQAAVLRHLDEPTPMSAIADHLGVDASYVTALVDRLEELGYVERRPDPADRRVKNIAITAAGERARSDIRSSFAGTAEPFEHLTKAEQKQLVALLEKAFPD